MDIQVAPRFCDGCRLVCVERVGVPPMLFGCFHVHAIAPTSATVMCLARVSRHVFSVSGSIRMRVVFLCSYHWAQEGVAMVVVCFGVREGMHHMRMMEWRP